MKKMIFSTLIGFLVLQTDHSIASAHLERNSETEIVPPHTVETIINFQCSFDNISIRYSEKTKVSDRFLKVIINNIKINNDQLKNLNNFIDQTNIVNLKLISCPFDQNDKKPIGFFIETRSILKSNLKYIKVFSISRGGQVKAEKFESASSSAGELF